MDRREKLGEALAKSRQASTAIKDESLQPEKESSGSEETDLIMELDRRTILGKFEKKAKAFQPKSFDLVFFDPPWGVGFITQEGSQEKYEDKEDIIWERMPGWLERVFGLMKPNSHLYLVFGIVHHERIAYVMLLTN